MNLQTQSRFITSNMIPMSSHTVVQRKCDCGNHTTSQKCGACAKEDESLRRKPIVSGGRVELPSLMQGAPRSPGQPVDANTGDFAEPRFGQDFSQVRMAQPQVTPGRAVLMRSPKDSVDNPRDPLPDAKAMEELERATYEEYLRDCNGVSILKQLKKEAPISRAERARRLEDRLKYLRNLFRPEKPDVIETLPGQEGAERKEPSGYDIEKKFARGCIEECIFGKDYAPQSKEREIAIAQCELSETRWQAIAYDRHRHVPGQRNLQPDKAPWVPDPQVCFSPQRNEELIKLFEAGRGCDGQPRPERKLIL